MEMTSNNACPVKMKRKQGGQPGNQNARIHGFYSKVLDADEKRDYEEARNIQGMDEEIALLRAKINSILRHDPNNHKLFLSALATLSRLLMTHQKIARNDPSKLNDAIAGMFKNTTLPPGFGTGNPLDH